MDTNDQTLQQFLTEANIGTVTSPDNQALLKQPEFGHTDQTIPDIETLDLVTQRDILPGEIAAFAVRYVLATGYNQVSVDHNQQFQKSVELRDGRKLENNYIVQGHGMDVPSVMIIILHSQREAHIIKQFCA